MSKSSSEGVVIRRLVEALVNEISAYTRIVLESLPICMIGGHDTR